MSILLKLRNLIVLPILILTIITSPAAVSSDSAELISKDTFVLEQALMMGQGITTDGEYYYTSGAIAGIGLTFLAKFTVEEMELVTVAMNPLPDKCKDRRNDHIGGISWYDGKIYASVEGPDEGYPCIVVFDAETFECTDEVYDLPYEIFDDGVPWCAVDNETGYLYTSKWSDAETVYCYDVNNEMALVKEIPLTGLGIIDRIQGGEFYDGTLYLSADIQDNGNFKNILKLNVETGEVTLFAERNVGGNNIEAEGLTFLETADGAVMHVLDYNKLVGVFVHHYDVEF